LTIEKEWKMYNDIVQLKNLGLKKAQIAKKLSLSRPTVIKYFNMSPQEYLECLEDQKSRSKKTDEFEKEVVAMLKSHPDFTSAQIYDRLLEK
jgi:transposase